MKDEQGCSLVHFIDAAVLENENIQVDDGEQLGNDVL